MRTQIKINGQCQVYSESTTPRLLWNTEKLRRSASPSNLLSIFIQFHFILQI